MSERGDSAATRLGRLEADVGGLKIGFGRLEADVRNFGAILGRIEDGIVRAQTEAADKERLSKPPVVAVVAVLITLIMALISGAYISGANYARLDERTLSQQRELRLLHNHGVRSDVPAQ
jgi:hypothetical protein